MARLLFLLYGGFCYLVFLATFLYAVGFIGNILVPKAMDSPAETAFLPALLINLALLSLFAVQHSVMARPAFKRWWTRFVPVQVERSTYVLLSSFALILLFALWQPLGGVVWRMENTLAINLMWLGFVFGWGLVLVSTFLINHFDLFGLRQVWLHFRKQPYKHLRFATPGPYKLVRHPLYVGWLFAFWCTPLMTVTHLLFAVVTSVYILVAIQFEERDLLSFHGEDYRLYRERTPMLIPFSKLRAAKRRQV